MIVLLFSASLSESSGTAQSYLDDDGTFYITGTGECHGPNYNETIIRIVSMGNNIKVDGFNGCKNLISVDMPSATYVENAFSNCVSLISVNIPSASYVSGFSGCESLTWVHLPSANSIEGFEGCTSLNSVYLSSATIIKPYSFSGCKSLECIEMPSVTELGFRAFQGCTSLPSVSMPSVKKIGSMTSAGSNVGAFQECTSLSSVNIPLVTSIGSGSFSGCTSLLSITMPVVNYVGDYAFSGCTSMVSASASSAAVISSYAFSGCTSLSTFSMAKSIFGYAFRDCDHLESVYLPSVSYMETTSFYHCNSVSNLTIPCDGIGVFKKKSIADMTLTAGTGSGFSGPLSNPGFLKRLTVGDGVRIIGSGAFNGCDNLEYVYLADSVEKIEDMAFCGCTSLASFHAPESLASVGDMAFFKVSFFDVDGQTPVAPGSESFNGHWFIGEGGTLYREVPLEDGMEFSIGDLSYVVTSSEDMKAAVIGCAYGVSKVVVPDTVSIGRKSLDVTEISEKAFYGCTSLTSIDLGSVSKVGVKAFAQCTRLKSVYTGDSLSTISAYAFAKCTRLVDFDLEDSLKTLKVIGSYAFLKDAKLGGIAIPSFVTTIGDGAFALPFSDEHGTELAADAAFLAGYEYINSDGVLIRQPGVELGREFSWNGLTLTVTASLPAEVGISGYLGKPKSLVLSGLVELEGTYYNITSVMKDAFKGCRTILSADLAGVERLDAQAFYGCSNLKSFSAPDLVSVGTKAFARCASLIDLELGDSLKTIGAYGFWGCTSLESVELPDSVVSIGTYAFQRCSLLSSIGLGESLRLIGSKAFDGTAIVSLEIPDTIVRLKECALSGCLELREVSFKGGEKVILHAGIFEGTSNIEKITMPDGFKKIYGGALDGITFLDRDGNPLVIKPRNLAGHVFVGEGMELVLSA